MTTTKEVSELRNAVTNMDSLAENGLSQIRAIARLALRSLETPEGHRSMDDLAEALNAIWFLSENTLEGIGYQAETVGCNSVD